MIALAVALALAAPTGCTGPGEPRAVTYAALGASDAFGIGANPLQSGYVFLLRDWMTEENFEVDLRNFGIISARTDEIAARELPAAVAAGPDVVTLWTGANDLVHGGSPDQFAAQLNGILSELRGRTKALVFVGDLPDLTEAPLFKRFRDPHVTRARIGDFNARIRAAAAAHGAVLVPLSELPVDPAGFSADGYHPNNLGHRRIAEKFWERMRPSLLAL